MLTATKDLMLPATVTGSGGCVDPRSLGSRRFARVAAAAPDFQPRRRISCRVAGIPAAPPGFLPYVRPVHLGNGFHHRAALRGGPGSGLDGDPCGTLSLEPSRGGRRAQNLATKLAEGSAGCTDGTLS